MHTPHALSRKHTQYKQKSWSLLPLHSGPEHTPRGADRIVTEGLCLVPGLAPSPWPEGVIAVDEVNLGFRETRFR